MVYLPLLTIFLCHLHFFSLFLFPPSSCQEMAATREGRQGKEKGKRNVKGRQGWLLHGEGNYFFPFSFSSLFLPLPPSLAAALPRSHTSPPTSSLPNPSLCCLLSRVGDRPTATILQAQFHFLIFAWFFKGKIFDQNMPLLEGPIIL